MDDEPEDSLYDVLQEVLTLLPEALDFTKTIAEKLPEMVETLTTVAIVTNLLALHQYGGRLGPARSNALVEQVVGAAFQTFEGFDPHPTFFEKAAMLLRGITQGHPFEDANKRTGFLVAFYYLEQVGFLPAAPLPQRELVEFSQQVSTGEIRDVGIIAERLSSFWGYTTAGKLLSSD